MNLQKHLVANMKKTTVTVRSGPASLREQQYGEDLQIPGHAVAAGLVGKAGQRPGDALLRIRVKTAVYPCTIQALRDLRWRKEQIEDRLADNEMRD